MEEQSKPEREGKGQDPKQMEKAHGHEGTTADVGMISKGSSGAPKADPKIEGDDSGAGRK